MRHDFAVCGARVALRPVGISDAPFILQLRRDPDLGRFIHATSPRLADQEAWLAAYEQRPGDYYFIIEEKGEPVGAVAIYDVDPIARTAEWGRWLVRRGSMAALESALLIYDTAFETLGLETVYCRTLADNGPVISFHNSSGAEEVAVIKDYVSLPDGLHDAVEHRMTKARWSAARPKLAALAQRLGDR